MGAGELPCVSGAVAEEKEETVKPLPRGDVREFENWMLRELVYAMRHYDRIKDRESPSMWIALGEATRLSTVLSHYTDRDPEVLQAAALLGYRELRRVIDEGASHMAELSRHIEEREEKDT